MLVADQAAHIQKPFDSAFSLVEQDHEFLSLSVLSFEAT
jgi:hypothetical protein